MRAAELRVIGLYSGPPREQGFAHQREVERVEGGSTDPVEPVGERQVDGAGAAAVGVHPGVTYFRKSGTSRSSP